MKVFLEQEIKLTVAAKDTETLNIKDKLAELLFAYKAMIYSTTVQKSGDAYMIRYSIAPAAFASVCSIITNGLHDNFPTLEIKQGPKPPVAEPPPSGHMSF